MKGIPETFTKKEMGTDVSIWGKETSQKTRSLEIIREFSVKGLSRILEITLLRN